MATEKYLYWLDSESWKDGSVMAEAHIIVSGNQGTVSGFLELAEELRESFPQADNAGILCGNIVKSCRFSGSAIVIWKGRVARGEYPGWSQFPVGTKIDYLF